jgi:nucleotide-binding universal stress UspA family protein
LDQPEKRISTLSRILVAVDGSAYADRAFDSAAKMAKVLGSKLYAVSAVYLPSMPGAKAETVQALESQLQIEASQILSRYSAEARSRYGIEVETIVMRGSPSQAIMDAATANEIDLIVVGRRGLSGIKELFLGSVSHDLARSAKQPVLVVG